jgi:hypothetical protein
MSFLNSHGHFTEQCKCGIIIGQCRCPAPNKSIHISKKECTHTQEQIDEANKNK